MILLDLDGVMADFIGGVARLVQRDPPSDRWPGYGMAAVFGLPEPDIWALVDSRGASFWEGLAPTPFADAIEAVVRRAGPFVVATSPAHDSSSAAGKVQWMQRRWGRAFRDYAITPHKDAFARPGTVLIDDSEEQCDRFRRAGGDAFLVPQPWNAHGKAEAPDALAGMLTDFLSVRGYSLK